MSRLLLSITTLGLVAATASPAFAGDSSWLLCKGIGEQGAKANVSKQHLVASLLEHRGASGDTRDLEISLIYGARVARGTHVGKPGDNIIGRITGVKLISIDGKHPVIFTGSAELASDMSAFTLTGTLDSLYGDAPGKPILVPFSAKLTCETLDDLAIGHEHD